MSFSTVKCAASIKQMEFVNKTLNAYGTKYLMPQPSDSTCFYSYFCNEKDCPHHNREYFSDSQYPNEHPVICADVSSDEKKNIMEATKKICIYYGLGKVNDESTDSEKCDIISGFVRYMWDDNRTFYNREYDRIVCTTAFRHLQYKTQVMVNSASDDQRTRLMHSIEVQKIAKKIAIGIHANWELAETIAIAHDIGHPPFGHEGEFIIKIFLEGKDSGSFSHAMQSVKVLDALTEHPILSSYDSHGLRLSDYVLEGVLKHDSDTFTDGMRNIEYKQQYDTENLCGIIGVDKTKYIEKLQNYLQKNSFFDLELPQVLIGSVESQIVAWADKIAYLGHDWEEFIDTGLLEKMMSRINEMVLKIETIYNKNSEINDTDEETRQIKNIWRELKEINDYYMRFETADPTHAADIWKNVRVCIEKIICAINIIEKCCIKIETRDDNENSDSDHCHKYFPAKEYSALKNYLVMTISWAELLEVYPRTYGLKNDPIYVFYKYLTKIRSIIITPRVINTIIKRTNDYVNKIDSASSMSYDDYLIHCNEKWVYKYAYINRKMLNCSDARKYLKKSIRTCFLVGFHDPIENDDLTYIINMGGENPPEGYQKPDSGYEFDQKYNCMLYIFDFIKEEFINSTRVQFMKYTAQKILNTLLEYYYNNPNMLPFTYRNRYNEQQYQLAMKDNIPEVTGGKYAHDADKCKARLVADYIAHMTDRMAKLKYDEIASSNSKWSNSYSTDLT